MASSPSPNTARATTVASSCNRYLKGAILIAEAASPAQRLVVSAESQGGKAAMRISARADYAIRALLELAADTSRPLTCEGIAQSQGIPHRFLKAVFRDLRRAELVRSQRGCEGGYWVRRDAASISLAAVVAAVDGQLMTVHGESLGDQRYPGAAARLSELWGG